jgi:hypothetical protein
MGVEEEMIASAASAEGTRWRVRWQEHALRGVGVFLLDADGPSVLEPLGFRGQELSMRPFSCEPWSLARELSERFRLPLEVHSIVHAGSRVWIVLRRSCRYSFVVDNRQ